MHFYKLSNVKLNQISDRIGVFSNKLLTLEGLIVHILINCVHLMGDMMRNKYMLIKSCLVYISECHLLFGKLI